MKAAITITARMKSKRLQLKVLRYIKGKPMIEHMIDRLKLSKLADDIILCTSTNPQDEILVDIAEKHGIMWFRGSEDDVLDRLFNGATKYGADFIAGATADNPLCDPEYIDRTIQAWKSTDADYITSFDLPLGAYCHGVKVKALKRVIESKKENDTEIWGRFFEKSDEFKKEKVEVDPSVRYPDIRLTVDEAEDLELIRRIFDKFYVNGNTFKLRDVVKYMIEHPEVRAINQNTNHWTKGRV